MGSDGTFHLHGLTVTWRAPYSSAQAASLPEPAPMTVRAAAGWIDYLLAFLPPYLALMFTVGGDDLLVVACDLQTAAGQNLGTDGTIQVHFWILPDPATRRMGIV